MLVLFSGLIRLLAMPKFTATFIACLPRHCVLPPAAAVSRFKCQGGHFEAELTLDVNIDVYPLKVRPTSGLPPC